MTGQLSRRDALQDTMSQIRDIVQEAAAANANANASSSPNRQHSSNAASASQPVSSPPLSPRTRMSALPTSPNQLADYLQRMGSNLQNAMQGSPLNGANTSGKSPYTSLGPVNDVVANQDPVAGTSRQSLDSMQAGDGDDLPDYAQSRQQHGHGVPIVYRHSLSSKKIEIELESVGTKGVPVYVENLHPTVKGKVRLRLGQGVEDLQSVNELRIRVKGVVTTAIKRQTHARGLGEEEEFWYASSLLWTASEEQPFLDGKKEVHEFPFSMTIPPVVPTGTRIRKQYRMPPSFALTAAFTDSGVDSASIRYYVKVTLARKGLLKANDRVFASIVYLNRTSDLSFLSDARRAWLVQQIPLESPLRAPNDWEGRVEEREIRKGFLARKHFNLKVALLAPRPLIFGKIESLPYYIRISSPNASMLADLGPSSLYVGLLQRTVVWAAGTPAVHELAVVKGVTELAPEADSGDDGPAKRFRGTLQLNKAPATSFRSHNLEVSYVILLNLVNPSTGVAQDTLLQLPISIVSIPPVSRHAAEVQRTNDATRRAEQLERQQQAQPQPQMPPLATPSVTEADLPELPPSYYDVVEDPGGERR